MYNRIQYQSSFQKIVEVKILHEFFLNKQCNTFQVHPTNDTATLLKNYGILFKPSSNGFVLIRSNEKRFKSPLFSGSIKLVFILKNNDPYFLNYTEIDFVAGKYYTFKNNDESELLHPGKYVDSNVETIEEHTELFSGEITLTINQGNEFFGESEVEQSVQSKQYQIRFNARNVVTRYNFLTQQENFIQQGYFIEENQKNISSNFKERILANGKKVFSTELNSSTPLSQAHEFYASLKRKGRFFNTFEIKLPTHNIKNISKDKDSKKIYADIFINID